MHADFIANDVSSVLEHFSANSHESLHVWQPAHPHLAASLHLRHHLQVQQALRRTRIPRTIQLAVQRLSSHRPESRLLPLGLHLPSVHPSDLPGCHAYEYTIPTFHAHSLNDSLHRLPARSKTLHGAVLDKVGNLQRIFRRCRLLFPVPLHGLCC
jgi:hypothetical protein